MADTLKYKDLKSSQPVGLQSTGWPEAAERRLAGRNRNPPRREAGDNALNTLLSISAFSAEKSVRLCDGATNYNLRLCTIKKMYLQAGRVSAIM